MNVFRNSSRQPHAIFHFHLNFHLARCDFVPSGAAEALIEQHGAASEGPLPEGAESEPAAASESTAAAVPDTVEEMPANNEENLMDGAEIDAEGGEEEAAENDDCVEESQMPQD